MTYKLGIIGGMGPMATANFFVNIVAATKATCDQEHLSICILNNPQIPDRSDAIISGKESPVPLINEGIKILSEIGCEYFVIPCNTAHTFRAEFKYQNIKFIDMIDTTITYLRNNFFGKKICILGTEGLIKGGIYDYPDLDINYPEKDFQTQIMKIIRDVKKGLNKEEALKEQIIAHKNEYDVFVLACTELSLYYHNLHMSNVIDSEDLLIKAVLHLTCKQE